MKPTLPVSQPSPDASQKKPFVTPSSLKSVLIVSLVLLILGSGAGYYLSYTSLSAYARAVQQTTVDAKASTEQIQTLQLLRGQLAQNNNLLTTADNLFAPQANASSIAEADIRRYAELTGVGVSAVTASAPSGASSLLLSVSFSGPVSYQSLSAFLVGVENNIPKLQVDDLAITRTAPGDQITVTNLSIKVYTK